MTESSMPTIQEPENRGRSREHSPPSTAGGFLSRPRPALSKFWWAVRVGQVRLRFLVVLAAAFLIVGKWHVLRNYWDTLTLPAPNKIVSGSVSGESEYFCPMCPGVISVWPTKCSVCNMPLVRRKKGDVQQLPDGVLARMQISPYRVHLAGIQTTAVEYRPLVREVVARGEVMEESEARIQESDNARQEAARVAVDIDQRDLPFVAEGAPATVAVEGQFAGKPLAGRVLHIGREVSRQTHRITIDIEVADLDDELWPGMLVDVRIRRPVCELEPFCSQPANPPAIKDGELRKLYTCMEHPDVLREQRDRCPEDDNLLMDLPLTDLQRVGWWCPMHPDVCADEPGHDCVACNGMRLMPRIVQYRPVDEVLAVPESAVIDLGDHKVVYVERMAGMFDAVEVVLGPRCGGYYPAVQGLEPGDLVAARGAFLLDAETRLNPSVAAGYFGASLASTAPHSSHTPSSGNPSAGKDAAAIRAALDKLSPDDRASAERQKLCPMTGMALGSMGTPVKIEIKGQAVWLCCAGCEVEASEHPDQTLGKLGKGSGFGVQGSADK
jgi:hypothetical protein